MCWYFFQVLGAHTTSATPLKDIQHKATCGEFMHLEDFLLSKPFPPSHAMELHMDAVLGAVTYCPHWPQNATENFGKWPTAWNGFEHLLVNHNYTWYNALVSDGESIQNANCKYSWLSVYASDQQVWANQAESCSFKYGAVSNGL